MNLVRRALDRRASVRATGVANESSDNGWQDRGARFGAKLRELTEAQAPQPYGELESYFEQHSEGLGIWKWRHYFPVYERHLEPFRGKPVRLLEIGVYSGGSLEMWSAYLGAEACIVGVDIEPSCRTYARPGIEIVVGDQSDPSFWGQFLANRPPFDIVIDDGGHRTEQQVATIEAVLPRMAPGGVYVCEDVHHEQNGFAAYMAGLATNLHAMRPTGVGESLAVEPTAFQKAVHSIHCYPYLIVIERRHHRLDELVAPMRGSEWNPHFG